MGKKKKKDLLSLIRDVNASLGRGPRQGLSVKPGQNKVLKILGKQGSMSQQDVLTEVGVQPGTLGELLGKLEKDGYITRHLVGRGRQYLVEITEKGRISTIEHELSIKNRDEELFGSLEPNEKAEITRILNKLLNIWGKNPNETEGQRRDRTWKENERLQTEQREINQLLESIE